MRIAVMTIELYAGWAHTLKEKRMEVKSLCARLRNTFNISVAEIDAQDKHQRIVLGVAAIAADSAQADSILDHALRFIEAHSEAELIRAERALY